MVGDISGLYAAKEDGKYLLEGFVSVRDFAVSENKQTVAVTGSGTSIFTEIQEEGFFTSHSLSVKGNALALNEDGSLLVVATEESLEFWSTETRTVIHTIPLKETNIPGKNPIRLLFSPKNSLIAVGYQNGLIEIFGVPSN
jgi:WD40 repeat protein